MPDVERVAVLESRVGRNEKDVSRLFESFREHMKKEEEDRAEIIGELSGMRNTLDKQKSFWAGMLFAFTGVGTIIGSAFSYLKG